jgi:hypothetical protein
MRNLRSANHHNHSCLTEREQNRRINTDQTEPAQEAVSMKDEIEATCPECSRTKRISREWLGRKIQCPCGNEFLLEYPAVKNVEVEKSLVEEKQSKKLDENMIVVEAPPDDEFSFDDFEITEPSPETSRPKKQPEPMDRTLTEWMLLTFGVICIFSGFAGVALYFNAFQREAAHAAFWLSIAAIISGVSWFATLQICEHLREILNELRRK